MTIVEKIEAFLDEMTDLSKSDPERVMDIMRAFGGLLIMAEMMKEETKHILNSGTFRIFLKPLVYY